MATAPPGEQGMMTTDAMHELTTITEAAAGERIVSIGGIAIPGSGATPWNEIEAATRGHQREARPPKATKASARDRSRRKRELEAATAEWDSILQAVDRGDAVLHDPTHARALSTEPWILGSNAATEASHEEEPRHSQAEGVLEASDTVLAVRLERDMARANQRYAEALAAAEKQRADSMQSLLEQALGQLNRGSSSSGSSSNQGSRFQAPDASLASPAAAAKPSALAPTTEALAAARAVLSEKRPVGKAAVAGPRAGQPAAADAASSTGGGLEERFAAMERAGILFQGSAYREQVMRESHGEA